MDATDTALPAHPASDRSDRRARTRSMQSLTMSVSVRLSSQMPQRHPRGVVAAHAMHPAAGRRPSGAEIQRWIAGGIKAPARPQKELQTIDRAATDVAALQVSVHVLQIGGGKDAPRQHA